MDEALKMILVAWLLVFSVAAAWGIHGPMMLWAGRVFYSLVRIFVFVFSFGRLRLTPMARRASLRSRRARRNLRSALRDLRRQKDEESFSSGAWLSGGDKTPPTGAGPDQ